MVRVVGVTALCPATAPTALGGACAVCGAVVATIGVYDGRRQPTAWTEGAGPARDSVLSRRPCPQAVAGTAATLRDGRVPAVHAADAPARQGAAGPPGRAVHAGGSASLHAGAAPGRSSSAGEMQTVEGQLCFDQAR